MTTPNPQALEALRHAQSIRLARYQGRRQIRDGQLRAADVVIDPPAWARNMTTLELLASQQRWGTRRSTKLLQHLQLPLAWPLARLTERQRQLLAGALQART